jgi:aminomethyltransferase
MVAGGESLMKGGVNVGVVNSPCFSHRLGKSLALAHVNSGIANGTILQLISDEIETSATIVSSPVYDPLKLKTHA